MENWISATPTQGSGNGSVNVTVSKNSGETRSSPIAISGGEYQRQFLLSKQIM